MRVLTYLALTLFFFGCTASTLPESETSFKHLTKDSALLQNLALKTNALNLGSIENGVDSFELRIWHGLSMAKPNWLTTLKYQDSTWHLTQTDYWFNYHWTIGNIKYNILDSSFTKALKVPSNISTLVDSVKQFRLDTFPLQREIPGFEDRVADGAFYQIEFATPHFYKAIGYSNPSRYADNHNQQMTRFLKMLKDIGVFSMP